MNGARRPDAIVLISFAAAAAAGITAIAAAEAFAGVGEGTRVAVLCAALAVVALLPAIVSMRRQGGRFDLMHPLFYASWFFFLPQFVVVMALSALTGQETFFGHYFVHPMEARVAALELAIVGSLGLSAGYLLPLGRRLGTVRFRMPALETEGRAARILALLLLGMGLIGAIGAFSSGLLGFQVPERVSEFGTLFANLSGLLVAGEGVVFFSLFRRRKGWRLLALAAVCAAVGLAAVSGSRAALFYLALAVVVSFQYAQARLRLRHLAVGGLILAVSLWAGMVAGSTYREVKTEAVGRAEGLSARRALEVQREATREVERGSLMHAIHFGWERIFERLDGVTSLAVIVRRAPALASAEREFGIDDNILGDAATALVPRFLWPEKPSTPVGRRIGELYFNLQDSAPAVTFMGDLFRNFGAAGVFPGMLLVGVALRAVYAWLVERRALSPLRVGLFLMLCQANSYEGLYSAYFPVLVRALAIAVLALVLARVALLVTSGAPAERPEAAA